MLSGEEMILPPELEPRQQISTPWLHYSKRREQLVTGVRIIGLEFSAQYYHGCDEH